MFIYHYRSNTEITDSPEITFYKHVGRLNCIVNFTKDILRNRLWDVPKWHYFNIKSIIQRQYGNSVRNPIYLYRVYLLFNELDRPSKSFTSGNLGYRSWRSLSFVLFEEKYEVTIWYRNENIKKEKILQDFL